MSEIKVNSIKGVAASSAAITVNNTDGTCTANLTNKPNRNLIINGAMQVAQRGTSFSLTGSGYTLDRFTQSVGSSFNMDTTITQSTDTPDTFKNSLKVTPDSTQTPTGSHNGTIVTRLEGQDLAPIGYGTSSCKQITLSFYAKSSSQNNGQTYTVQVQKVLSGSQKYVTKTFDITSSWQRFTMNFPADTATATETDNSLGMTIYWHLASGPDDIVAESPNAWVSQNGFRAATGQSNFMDNTSNEFYLTGVQLEVGSVATDFEHRSFGQELALCQRYYTQSYPHGVAAGSNSPATVLRKLASGQGYDDIANFHFPTEMRATPTIALYNPVTGTVNGFRGDGNDFTGATIATATTRGVNINRLATVTATVFTSIHATASAEL